MKKKPTSYLGLVRKKFNRNILNRLGLWLVLTVSFIAIFAPFLANSIPIYVEKNGETYFPILREVWPTKLLNPYPDLKDVDYDLWEDDGATIFYPPVPYSPNDYDLDSMLLPPDPYHWLGTDEQGRDVLSRMIFGARISLSVGFIAVGLYTLIGIFVGAWAGYFGGWWDMTISRVIEIVICFPTFFLILTLLSLVGPSIYNIMFVIGLTGWTGIARLVRGEFFKLREMDYVVACRAQGLQTPRILFRHILPNALAPVLVSASFGVPAAILAESALSFLGFGVQPPTPSWGDLLSQSREFIDIAWWLTVFPGFAIFLTITAFNLVGKGLRDALDPKAL